MGEVTLAAEPRGPEVFHALVMRAVEQNMPLEHIERFVALLERQQARQAESDFAAAFARAKAEMPPIYKDRHVRQEDKRDARGNVEKMRPKYWHVTLSNLTQTCDPVLARHGLSVSWTVTQSVLEDEQGKPLQMIKVEAVMRHAGGHSVRVDMSAPPDTQGAKTAVQAVASTVTYLQRYTYSAVVGVAAQNPDEEDDGAGGSAGEKELSEEAAADYAKIQKAAAEGRAAFAEAWKALTREQRDAIGMARYEAMKRAATQQSNPNDEDA